MTWTELGKLIDDMPESELAKTVYYREPYDEAAEMFPVDLLEAQEDLADAGGGAIRVGRGEKFLQ